MFVDEDLDSVEFKSTWKKERSLAENGCQTKDLLTEEVGVQSIKRKNKECQTEEEIEEDIQLYDDDSSELISFMKNIEPFMTKELQKNLRSHAFDGYDVMRGEETDSVTNIHTLSHADLKHDLQITGLSWNSTGSVIVAAYGRYDHEDWCTHKSALCTWNLDRRTINADKPDSTIDLSSCLICIACHPQKPSLIAGGTFNGEIMVWDTSKEDEMLVASSGIGDDSHREPVSKVHWVKDADSKSKRYNIVSVSADGRILVWKMQHKKSEVLKLKDGFVLLTESLPRQLRVKAKRGDKEMGVTCISYNTADESTFLIGSESGGVFKCSTNARGTPASRDLVCSVDLRSPVTFCFSPHNGPVYGVESAPYHRNLFLTCGTDNTARIYSMLQTQSVLSFEPGAGYLYSAKWSPVRPSVIAVAAENGQLLIYDLKQNKVAPVLRIDASVNKQPLYSMQFNPHQTQLLATGDGAGHVQIWKLKDDLTQQSQWEDDVLDDIASTALE